MTTQDGGQRAGRFSPEGAAADPLLPAVVEAIQYLFTAAGKNVPTAAVNVICQATLAVARAGVADQIAVACDQRAADAPPGHGLDYDGGQVVGYLAAAGIARRHAVNPPSPHDDTPLNAAYVRGERTERQRIVDLITRLPDSPERERILKMLAAGGSESCTS